jgi:hypothetical protein
MKRFEGCVFCGFVGKLTGEHILPKWLRNTGLSLVPMSHVAGPLNRNVADLGVSSPFNRTLEAVCRECNQGWMSKMEASAKRVLRSAILGASTTFDANDHAVVSAWIHKTGLISALFASRVGGSLGRGLPEREYRELFASRDRLRPLPATQFWVGRYEEKGRAASTWVTPMIVSVSGVDDPPSPQAYLITLQLGPLLLQGVRFTAPHLFFELSAGPEFAQVWPSIGNVDWPGPATIEDEAFVTRVTKGLHLRSGFPGLKLRPWPEATDLPRGVALGGAVSVVTPCGSHTALYPDELVHLAREGNFHWFKLSCDCGTSYLVRTDRGRIRFRDIGSASRIGTGYEALPGQEVVLETALGPFTCKPVHDEDDRD